MQRFSLKSALAVSASAAMLAGGMAAPSYAQSSDTSVAEDEIITIGTRRKARSASDVIAPVDVIPATELLIRHLTSIHSLSLTRPQLFALLTCAAYLRITRSFF